MKKETHFDRHQIMFPIQQPIFCRLLEGLSSFCMVHGFLKGGGSIQSTLFLFYLLHAIASFSFRLFPHPITQWMNSFFVDLLFVERGYSQPHHLVVFAVYWFSLFLSWNPHLLLIFRIASLVLLQQPSFYVMFLWMLCLLTFLQNLQFRRRNQFFNATLTCCLYHFYLGVISYLEVPSYSSPSDHSLLLYLFLRHCVYFSILFFQIMSVTTNPKRLRSILSLTTALILSPFSFYELFCQYHHGRETIYHDAYQSSMILLYVSYCFVDTVFGQIYYHAYFPLLEGWIHHIGTACFALYFLWQNTMLFFCIGLVLETSSLLLLCSRIFYDVKWIRLFYATFFPILFLFFRLLLPSCFMIYFYPIVSQNTACCLMYCISMVLNCYWLSKQKMMISFHQ